MMPVMRLTRMFLSAVVPALLAGAAASCGDVNTALAEVSQARQLSADLLVQFTKTADAANRAVMADTDETSLVFAREAEAATSAVQKDADALTPLLKQLNYADETRLLGEFVAHFAEYRALDRRILDLAVENTNLKAQRLSFMPALDAANELRDSLKMLAPAAGKDPYEVQALAATAVMTVREIQVLQAPHIADADEAMMTHMEQQMATSATAARQALTALRPLVSAASRPRLDAAGTALTKFMDLNAQIIALSRRNTTVRSLALSLDQKRTITVKCEDSLHALDSALSKRGYTGIRER